MKKNEEKIIPMFGIYRKSEGWVCVKAMYNVDSKKVTYAEDSIEDTRAITEETFKRQVAKHWMELDNA